MEKGEAMVTFLLVLSIVTLGFVVVARMLGLIRKPLLYLGIAFSAYIFSFVSGFTIGLGVLSVTFVAGALAVAHSWKRAPSASNAAVAVAAGLATWAVAIAYVDDVWLFSPLRLLFF